MPNSKVEKGKRFEKYIAEQIRACGLDERAHRESGSGNGKRKGDISSSIPFLIEAKNDAGVPKWLLEKIDQAKIQAEKGFAWKDRWALVFRDPRTAEKNSSEYAVIDFSMFLELLLRFKEPKVKEPDRTLKWKIENLKRVASEVIKELG